MKCDFDLARVSVALALGQWDFPSLIQTFEHGETKWSQKKAGISGRMVDKDDFEKFLQGIGLQQRGRRAGLVDLGTVVVVNLLIGKLDLGHLEFLFTLTPSFVNL